MDAKSPDRVPTYRCSTIFVSEGSETLVYRSLGEMPTHLRNRITARTRGGASATIFIANRGGREELAKRLRGMPSRVETRLEETVPATVVTAAPAEPPSFTEVSSSGILSPAVRHGVVVVSGLCLLAWLLSTWG